MKDTLVQPYLFFGGRCEEAMEFYRTAIGAQVEVMMLFKDSPQPVPAGVLQDGFESKVMHASFRIGGTTLMASDGCKEGSSFSGFSLSLSVPTEAESARLRRVRQRWQSNDAAGRNILVDSLRHAHRPFWNRLDGNRPV